ncbi:unnamed protein product [Spirodela intermedia]|uniref:Uncharacterized protein n=1 Tax=Spirodela intermedia TaxID=51605 RepID=A0A7I8JTN6_SPIIN|nr:unnamed protein product [Spirodela intermedia]CAA6673540.1 unnamed protein product [Spirodela intermedia]
MVARFRRSISLPGRNPKSDGGGRVCPLQPAKPPPARSTSLPSHAEQPAVAQVEEELRAAGVWHSSGPLRPLCRRREAAQRSAPIRRRPRVLPHGHRLSAGAAGGGAGRRPAEGWRKARLPREVPQEGREGARRDGAGGPREGGAGAPLLDPDGELAAILKEVSAATAAVSAAVFRGTAAAVSLAAAVVGSKSSSWAALRRRVPPMSSYSKNSVAAEEETAGKRSTAAMAALAELGECLSALEIPSERTFRRLINARVSVLNILTP